MADGLVCVYRFYSDWQCRNFYFGLDVDINYLKFNYLNRAAGNRLPSGKFGKIGENGMAGYLAGFSFLTQGFNFVFEYQGMPIAQTPQALLLLTISLMIEANMVIIVKVNLLKDGFLANGVMMG